MPGSDIDLPGSYRDGARVSLPAMLATWKESTMWNHWASFGIGAVTGMRSMTGLEQ